MKILICDDDRDFRAMLYFHLHKTGHEVLSVSDAVHAIALLGDPDHKIQLVIMDIMMPRLTGEEIMESFSNWNSCKTNFIIVSGHENPGRFESYEHVVGCLAKPFRLEELDKLIAKVPTGAR